MSQLQICESAVVPAPADQVYSLLADYQHGHPRILPRDTFQEIQVEAGGTGAGTLFRLRSKVLGVERTLRMSVSEPEPGRVLAESDRDSDLYTTFTVEPVREGAQSRVTIHTTWTSQPGVAGLLERFLIRGLLQKVYVRELELLAKVFAESDASASVK